MKKVEVYFLINLGAILSLFAIEGELSIYMQRQDDILKNVAQDKLQTLVEISNVESNYDDSDYYRLFFNVEGQYEQGSIQFEPSFTTSIVEVEGDSIKVDDSFVWELDSIEVVPFIEEGDKNRYVAKVKVSSIEETYLNQPFDVNLGVKFIPDIDTVTYAQWTKAFGDYTVTDKLLEIIDSEVASKGSFEMNREFDTPITLIYMDGQQAEFFVLFDKEKYTVLKGLDWAIPFSIGGVNSEADFNIEISGGKDLVSKTQSGLPRSFIKGKGTSDGTIEIVGLRKRDKKSSVTKAKIVVVDPQYSSPTEDKEIYIGEQYVFDSRVKDVDRRLARSRSASSGLERLEAYIDAWGNYIPEIYGVANALMMMSVTDDDARLAWNGRLAAMREGCDAIVATLSREGRLSHRFTPLEATDLLCAHLSVETWRYLRDRCGWNQTRYVEVMQQTLKTTLLE